MVFSNKMPSRARYQKWGNISFWQQRWGCNEAGAWGYGEKEGTPPVQGGSFRRGETISDKNANVSQNDITRNASAQRVGLAVCVFAWRCLELAVCDQKQSSPLPSWCGSSSTVIWLKITALVGNFDAFELNPYNMLYFPDVIFLDVGISAPLLLHWNVKARCLGTFPFRQGRATAQSCHVSGSCSGEKSMFYK